MVSTLDQVPMVKLEWESVDMKRIKRKNKDMRN